MGRPLDPGCLPFWGNLTDFEGNNARALRLLEIECGLSRAQLVGVLASNPGAIHSYAEYYAALRAVYPTCQVDLNPPRFTDLPSPPPVPVSSQAAALAVEQRDRSRLAEAVADLRTEYRLARTAARVPCAFGTQDCGALQTEPFALWAARKQAMLELRRRSRLKLSGDPYDPRTAERVERSRRWFERKYAKVLERAYSRAAAAVSRLEGDYTGVLQELEERRQVARDVRAGSSRLPAYASVIVALDGAAGGTDLPVAVCDESAPTCGGECPAGEVCAASIDAPYDCACYGEGPACAGSEPTCGGACPEGQVCAASVDAPFACGCYPAAPPCADSEPSCGGACPEGEVCAGSIDPPYDCGCYPQP